MHIFHSYFTYFLIYFLQKYLTKLEFGAAFHDDLWYALDDVSK